MKKNLMICLFLCMANISNAQIEGGYQADGYFFHPTSSRSTGAIKFLTLISPNVYEAYLSDLGSTYTFRFSIDATNHLTGWTAGGSTPVEPASGFMTADNPGNFTFNTFQPGTAGFTQSIYNNTYDPATRTFYMHYGYAIGSTGQNGYTRQVYEKWTWSPGVHISSVTPMTGGRDTKITLRGSGFTTVPQTYYDIQFGGELADSVAVLSDTLIYAWPSYGSSGDVLVGNAVSSDYVPGFTYLPTDPPTNLQWQYTGPPGFSTSRAKDININIDNEGNPVVAYVDSLSGKATAMRYVSGSWISLGFASFGKCSHLKMNMDNYGNPIVAYVDSFNLNRISVFRLSGGTWFGLSMPVVHTWRFSMTTDKNNITYVGVEGDDGSINVYKYNYSPWTLSANIASTIVIPADITMAMDTATNTPYLLYRSYINNTEGWTGMKLTGSLWTVVGNAQFANSTTWGVDFPDMKIDKNSVPVVLSQEDNGFERLSCFKPVNNTWTPVSQRFFSGTRARLTSLTLDKYNTPFAAFYDVTAQGLTVMGISPLTNNWDTVGPRGFKPMYPYILPTMAITCNNHTAYVAFADETQGGKISVMQINTICYNNINTWTGEVSNAWENPGNWGCGTAPQPTSNVLIPTGSVVTVNSSTTINSLYVQTGASVTVGAGVVLTVLHP